jgi:1,4-dihydroxy-2-naphthoyl-CoA hydrolase
MPFSYPRTIHFADTDAAGVVFFANYLALCHEAYEEALAATGINIARFFADHGVIIPIAHSTADYLRPMACGEKIRVTITPVALSENSFALDSTITKLGPPEKLAARIRTEHVCIDAKTRARADLPAQLAAWVRGS